MIKKQFVWSSGKKAKCQICGTSFEWFPHFSVCTHCRSLMDFAGKHPSIQQGYNNIKDLLGDIIIWQDRPPFSHENARASS